MKVSLNWVKEFIDVDLTIDQLVERIGAQLGAVEEVIDLGRKYQGIVVAKVVSCVKHPDANKLHVCTIDDGGSMPDVERDKNGLIQVVCGAPNVREGLLVAWLPPGSTVPSSYDTEPFVLEAREIRGVVSNGMLASAHELGISDDHSGILELGEFEAKSPRSKVECYAEIKPGDDFAKVYNLDDYIIDIENKMFTHRPDCFGQLGVAREIAGIECQKFTSPDWYMNTQKPANNQGEVMQGYGVTIEIPELCPRYMLLGLENVKIGSSPVWLQTCLSRVGIRPINNIVDMTNYMMMLTGQPLHAFDFDKVAHDGVANIVVRNPHKGEKMTLLDGKTIEPRPDAILICDQDKPIALGGVMGGNNSEIDEHTTRILIECANFDMYNIRKTAMEHGIFTDAVTRFNKGQSALQCPAVLYKAVQMAQEVSPGSKPIGEPVDVFNSKQEATPVKVTAEFINARLGLKLSAEEMAKLLTNVEFKVEMYEVTDPQLLTTNYQLLVIAPFWRTDIEIPEDVVEEVGRLYGYDHLPLELPKRDLTPALKNELLELKQRIRVTLSKAGANEVLTYSFVHGNLLEKSGQDKTKAFQLSNALSPDLQYYRMSLTPSLLDKIHTNIKSGYDQFALFEIGKLHMKGVSDPIDPEVPLEDNHIALVVAAADKLKPVGSAYYRAKKYLEQLAPQLAARMTPLVDFDFKNDEWGKQLAAPYLPERSGIIVQDGTIWGIVGEFKPVVGKTLKLPAYSAGFEVGLDVLAPNESNGYIPLPRFPKVQQDISLRVPASTSFQAVSDLLSQQLLQQENMYATLEPLDIYQRPDDLEHKQFTFRFTVASYEKTLKSEEVNALLDQAAIRAKKELSAERI